MTGGFHTKSSANWLIGEFPPHKIPTFFGPKMLSLWVFQQTTPELTELKRKHQPSSLARVWVGNRWFCLFRKKQKRRSANWLWVRCGLLHRRWWVVGWRNDFCWCWRVGLLQQFGRWFGWIASGQPVSHWIVMPRCELSPVSYCRLVVVRAMSGLNEDQDKLTMYFFVYWLYITYIYIIKSYNIHILNLHYWIFCGFVFFNSYLVNTFSDRRPW